MQIFSQIPAYNLKIVLYETGLTADILRAWERRYQLPVPQRTPGGHRLYSKYDIETLKWLKARQAEGLSISRAVKLWRGLIESGRDPLAEFSSVRAAPVIDHLPAGDANLETLRRLWLEAGLVFDEAKSDAILDQAFSVYPFDTVCMEILQRGLSSIGADWYHNKVSAQQEHFISGQTIRRLENLIAATPRPTRKKIVLIGCPPGEWHTIPVLLLYLFLRRRGLEVIYLGADIPVEQLEETAAVIRPDLIVLAAQQLTTAAALRSAALAIQNKAIPLAYGGLIFNRVPKLRESIPAYFLGENLEEAVQSIERLVLAQGPFLQKLAVGAALQDLARLYREKRPIIEVKLSASLPESYRNIEFLAEANTFFGQRLSAALDLGDPALLETDLDWVKHLLNGRQIPADKLLPYLAAYSQAVRQELGNASAPLTDWVAAYINKNSEASA